MSEETFREFSTDLRGGHVSFRRGSKLPPFSNKPFSSTRGIRVVNARYVKADFMVNYLSSVDSYDDAGSIRRTSEGSLRSRSFAQVINPTGHPSQYFASQAVSLLPPRNDEFPCVA
jgi:hypothetical protein